MSVITALPLREREQLFHKHKAEFKQIFGVDLEDYQIVIGGFPMSLDVMKLDEDLIKPEDGTSTAQATLAQFGERAVELLRELF